MNEFSLNMNPAKSMNIVFLKPPASIVRQGAGGGGVCVQADASILVSL